MNNLKKLAIVISTLIICAFSMTGCEEGGSGQSSVSEADSVLSAENASASVSYTHLDVYKRQLQSRI